MKREPAVLLDLNAIASEPGATGSFAYSLDLPNAEEFASEGPVRVSLDVHNTGKALLVYGKFEGAVHLACARCLADVLVDVQGKIDEQFSLPGVTIAGLELIDQVEPAESAFTDQVLNVTELVRQQILLSLPMRVVCSDDCQGLCPVCGHNLNEGSCGCPQEEGHPAWKALRDLASKQKKD
jgi:uncharacterized protein